MSPSALSLRWKGKDDVGKLKEACPAWCEGKQGERGELKWILLGLLKHSVQGRRVGCVLVVCQRSFPKLPAWQRHQAHGWHNNGQSPRSAWVGECVTAENAGFPLAVTVLLLKWPEAKRAGEIRTRQGENWHVIPSRLGTFLRCWNRGSQAHETVAKVAPYCSKRTQVEHVSFKHPH